MNCDQLIFGVYEWYWLFTLRDAAQWLSVSKCSRFQNIQCKKDNRLITLVFLVTYDSWVRLSHLHNQPPGRTAISAQCIDPSDSCTGTLFLLCTPNVHLARSSNMCHVWLLFISKMFINRGTLFLKPEWWQQLAEVVFFNQDINNWTFAV